MCKMMRFFCFIRLFQNFSFWKSSLRFISIILLLLILGCQKYSVPANQEFTEFFDFRKIPGVTQDEVQAIEAIRAHVLNGRGHFVYGMVPGTVSFLDPDGNVRGFSALFCEWLTVLFDIPFKAELVPWDEFLQRLENFRIDFTGLMTATEQRRQTFFMTTEIAINTVKYFRLADSTPLEVIAAQRLLRYGFIEGSITLDQVIVHLEPGTFEAVLAGNTDEIHRMLHSGEIDAFINDNVAEASFDIFGDVIARDFLPLIHSPVSLSTQNPALSPIISVVQKALDAGVFPHLFGLYGNGYQEYMKNKLFLQLSEEERRYLLDNPVVPAVIDALNYPVSFFNQHYGEWQGIALDVLNEVEMLTGFSFEVINTPGTQWYDLSRMIEEGEASVFGELYRTEEIEARFLWPQNTVFTNYPALLSRMEFRDIMVSEVLFLKVGVIENHASTEMFYRWFLGHTNTVQFSDIDAAFRALTSGEIDLLMSTQSRLLMQTHLYEQPGYKVNIMFDFPFESTFVFNRDEAILCSIFDKALALTDTKGITDRWMRRTFDYRSVVAEAQRPWLIGSSVLLLSILALIVVFFERSLRSGKRLEKIVKDRTRDLQLQTSLLSAVFDSSPDFLFCKDLESRYIRCNDSTKNIFRVRVNDIVGRTDAQAYEILPHIVEEFIREDQQVIRERKPFVFEGAIQQSDSERTTFIETTKAPLILNGEVIGVVGIARDITKRREMEEAALAASRSKSTFLANMSHEIRTPMNSIIGFSELAMDGETSLKTKEYLGKILQNAEGLLLIINDILDLSKVESGRIELESIPFDMHELLNNCRSVIMPMAIEKGIIVHFYAEPSIGKMPLGDTTRLRQILVNLLSNAVKFTNKGMIKLLAEIKEKTDTTVTMRFEVKDSGIGMTTEQIEKIFEPFTQADADTTRRFGGTGLGLAIAKSMVELMGGMLYVESIVGVGSKFSFELCFETIDVINEEIKYRRILFNELEKPVFDGEVLLCEDNVMNQQVIYEHLERVGLKIVIAENGKIGLETVKKRLESGKKQFDLIFMDIHMPVMDGLEAAAKIIELNTGVPIIALTANIMSSDREMYMTSGMNDYVGKPFTSQELWRCLIKYLKPVSWKLVNGVLRTQAETELRYKSVKTFLKDNRNKYSEIEEAVNSGNIKLAHRLAHNLKGNAGQLGKTLLQDAAGAVEKNLENNLNLVTGEQLKILETELEAALAQFTAELGSGFPYSHEQENGADKLTDAKSALELIEKTEGLLEMGSPECRELSGELRRLSVDEERKELLIQQIEDLDFDSALVTLAELKKEI